MSFYKQNSLIKVFNENIHLIALVVGGAYYIGNTLFDLNYRFKIINYEKQIETTLTKAKLHSEYMMLTNQLKYELDSHLE
jgi:hypothetical protein